MLRVLSLLIFDALFLYLHVLINDESFHLNPTLFCEFVIFRSRD